VVGCEEPAVRSVSLASLNLSELNLRFKEEIKRGKVYLCKKHYKEVKKILKRIKKLEKWRRGGFL